MAPGTHPRTLYELGKRAIDLAGASAGLTLAAPVVAAAALAIRITMGRPVLFRQERPGLAGAPFELVKLRTMRPLAGAEDGLAADAARLTPIGAALRRWSLDELPTLWNVVRGDMSLVGPRPLLCQYLDRYSPEQARRHEVKPGITGWAQINGRNAISWDQKLALDVWYVDHRSLSLDLRILLGTFVKVVKPEGISHGGEATMPVFMGSARTEPGNG